MGEHRVKDKIKIGIVGLGRLGRRHAENLANHVQDVDLVAAASPITSELEWAKAQYGIETYSNLASLLKHPGLDAVWLVTPTSLHAQQSIEVLEAGKHLFCEKPLSLDVPPCDEVIKVAESHKDLVTMIGFMRRFDVAYIKTKQALINGELGKVFRIHCESLDPVDPNAFFVKFAPTSGGIFLDCCIHDIDLVRWMLNGGKAKKVAAYGTRIMYPGLEACNDIDTGAAVVEFECGVLATFHVSRTSHNGYKATMDITGTSGSLSIGNDVGEIPLIKGVNGTSCRKGQQDFFSRFNSAFLFEATEFVRMVKANITGPHFLEDAREATRIAVAMRESFESGRPVELN